MTNWLAGGWMTGLSVLLLLVAPSRADIQFEEPPVFHPGVAVKASRRLAAQEAHVKSKQTIAGANSICQPSTSVEANDICTAFANSVNQAIANSTAPGMSVAIFSVTPTKTNAPSFSQFGGGMGSFTYDVPFTSAVSYGNTQYDMASCSKIMGGTTAVAQMYQRGWIPSLDMYVADPALLGPAFANAGKGQITVRNLLLHNAGFPPDPNPGYSSPLFPCPQNRNYHPGQDFSCIAAIYDNLLYNQTIVTPPGAAYVYSDLSLITIMFIVGKLAKENRMELFPDTKGAFPAGLCANGDSSNLGCWYYVYVKKYIFDGFGLTHTDFVPSDPSQTPPQWQDPWYHHGLIMGYVSDQNTYAMGGVSGHAGVFSTAKDTLTFMRMWMRAVVIGNGAQDVEEVATAAGLPKWATINGTTAVLFTTQYNETQSSRALGWDTNNQPQPPCGNMSPQTFLHIGYTGTQFCGDPMTGVVTVLLANGRYPNYHVDGMIEYRPVFGNLVQTFLG